MPPPSLQARLDGQRPYVYWYSGPKGFERDYTADPFQIYDDPIKFLNLDTGEITNATRAKVAQSEGVNAKGELTDIVVPYSRRRNWTDEQPATARAHVYFKNMETGVSRHVEFDMPGLQHTIINNRYAVSRDEGYIYAVDLEDSAPQVFCIASAYKGTNGFRTDSPVTAIFGTDLLCQVQPPTNSNSTLRTLEIFKIADHQIQLVKTIAIWGSGGVTRFEDQLLNLSADGKSVEFRSLDDLELVKSIAISKQILAEYDLDYVEGILVHGVHKRTSEPSFFHLITQLPIQLPQGGMRIWSFLVRNDRYWCFCSSTKPRSVVVYDMQEHRACLQIPEAFEVSLLEDTLSKKSRRSPADSPITLAKISSSVDVMLPVPCVAIRSQFLLFQ